MSTTPRDTHDDVPESGETPAADTSAGAHASPRPYPPSVPERRSVTSPDAGALPDTTWAPPAETTQPAGTTGATAAAPDQPPVGVAPTRAAEPYDPSATRPMPTTPPAPDATQAPPVAAAPSSTAPVPDAAVTPGFAPAGPAPGGAPAAGGAASLLGPEDPRTRRDIPDPPVKPGVARHLLGVLLGLLVTPVALLLVGVGVARLADIAGTSQMGSDVLGLSMLIGGVVLLVLVVLLGAWTPALPITGGLVWGLGLGAAYLAVPNRTNTTLERVFGDIPAPADQLAHTAMSGYLVLVGALLLAAGIATGVARRRGRRYAEQVAAVERAEAEQARAAEQAREQARAAEHARAAQEGRA